VKFANPATLFKHVSTGKLWGPVQSLLSALLL